MQKTISERSLTELLNTEINNGKSIFKTEMGDVPLSVLEHNLLNLEEARHICQQLGIMDERFL